MRISEMLEALQEIQNVLGDVDVCVVLNDFAPITEVVVEQIDDERAAIKCSIENFDAENEVITI